MPLIAHLATRMAGKWAAPEANALGLVVAAEALDLPHFPPVSLIVEVPFWVTHGLLMSVVWSAVVVGVMRLLGKQTRVCVVYGLAVFSHWILDFIAWPMGAVTGDGSPLTESLPLALSGSPMVGLGLYNHSSVTAYAFELGVTLVGVGAYVWFKRRERADALPVLAEV